MATIPSADRIGRRTPDSQAPVAAQRRTSEGEGLRVAGETIRDVFDARTQYRVAQAQSEFLASKVEQDNAYDQDQDYETIPARYEEQTRDSLEKAADLIPDPRLRQQFVQENEVRLAQGRERIKSLAFTKERDYQRSYVNSSLVNIRQAGLTGNMADAMNTAQDLVAAAVENDYYSAEEGEQVLRTWRDNAAVSRIEMLPPAERLEALQEGWSQRMPADARQRLRQTAERELVTTRAVETVDSLLAQDLSRQEAMDRVADLEDTELRLAAERRITNEFERQRVASAEQQSDLHNEYFLPVRRGEVRMDDIPRDVLDQMDPTTIRSLYAAEGQAASSGGGAPAHSDLETLNRLYLLKAQKDWVGLRDYFRKNADSLDPTDAKYWSETSVNGLLDPETEYALTSFQYLDAKVKTTLGDNAKTGEAGQMNSRIRINMRDWFENQKARTGQAPTQAEQDAWIDRQFLELPTRMSRGFSLPMPGLPGLFPGSIQLAPGGPGRERAWAEMTPEERGEAMVTVQQSEPEVVNDILYILGAEDLTQVNPDDFLSEYSRMTDGR